MPIDITYKDTSPKDTIYGITNELAIPTRNIDETTKIVVELTETLFSPSPLVVEVASWQIIILLIIILLIGFVKAFSNNRFKQGVKALFSYTVAQEITREEKVFFHRSNIFFTLVHLLSISLFVFQLREAIYSGSLNVNSFLFYLIILTCFGVIYFVKYISAKVLLFIFNDSSIGPEYIFNISLYNNLLGAVFVPILFMTYFSSVSFQTILLYFTLPLMLIVFALRLFRMIKIGRVKGVSYFYIFVYICSLEILPLVVLFRIFIL